jgi:hypothetical protein
MVGAPAVAEMPSLQIGITAAAPRTYELEHGIAFVEHHPWSQANPRWAHAESAPSPQSDTRDSHHLCDLEFFDQPLHDAIVRDRSSDASRCGSL